MPPGGLPGLQPRRSRRSRGGAAMSSGSIRRAQLVSPFGVGAMSILVNGTSVITAGLDHWYTVNDPALLELNEYRAQDWRLEQRLQVREFRLPPDYRIRRRGDDSRQTKPQVSPLPVPPAPLFMVRERVGPCA